MTQGASPTSEVTIPTPPNDHLWKLNLRDVASPVHVLDLLRLKTLDAMETEPTARDIMNALDFDALPVVSYGVLHGVWISKVVGEPAMGIRYATVHDISTCTADDEMLKVVCQMEESAPFSLLLGDDSLPQKIITWSAVTDHAVRTHLLIRIMNLEMGLGRAHKQACELSEEWREVVEKKAEGRGKRLQYDSSKNPWGSMGLIDQVRVIKDRVESMDGLPDTIFINRLRNNLVHPDGAKLLRNFDENWNEFKFGIHSLLDLENMLYDRTFSIS